MTLVSAESVRPSRKERERLQRQHEILDAARSLFAEKGYHIATLDEVAERAEFGKGTLYNYFESKHHILLAILQDDFDRLTAAWEQCFQSDQPFDGQLHCLIHETLAFFQTNRAFFHILMTERHLIQRDMPDEMGLSVCEHHKNYVDKLSVFFQYYIDSGYLKLYPAKMYASYLVHALYGLAVYWLDDPRAAQLTDMTETIVDLTLHGFISRSH